MIYLKRANDVVAFSSKQTFAIYDKTYPADINGNKLEDGDPRISSLKCYSFGDIYIETENVTYIYPKLYESGEWVFRIMEYIFDHLDDNNIVIDLMELWPLGDDDFRDPGSEPIIIKRKK